MSGLENMATILNFNGGKEQIKRMNSDKLKTLKRALLYSYQSATAQLADGREFRCLINPDHLKNQYDDKILSIPFEDVRLNPKNKEPKKTSLGIESIGIKPGDVFTWKENNSSWLVYLQRLEETAYFRAEIRRCKYTVKVDDTEYKCYAARPSTNEIDWRDEREKLWNDIDYTLQMYITKDEKTEAFFHRFTVVEVNGKPWEVQAIDNMSSDGIIILALKEWYQNSVLKERIEEENQDKPKEDKKKKNKDTKPILEGPVEVYPYDKVSYLMKNIEGGTWSIDSQKVKILSQSDTSILIEIVTGRSGQFNLKYIKENEEIINTIIKINSL